MAAITKEWSAPGLHVGLCTTACTGMAQPAVDLYRYPHMTPTEVHHDAPTKLRYDAPPEVSTM